MQPLLRERKLLIEDGGVTTMMYPFAQLPPRLKARIAGFFWLIVFVAGSLALYLRGGTGFRVANIVAPLCYAVATLFIYDLLKPVNKNLSLLAAVFSLAGCAVSLFGLTRFIGLRDLVFFGLHCLLVGYLILRSTFLPRTLGVLMVFAGLGWLTFLWRPLATPAGVGRVIGVLLLVQLAGLIVPFVMLHPITRGSEVWLADAAAS